MSMLTGPMIEALCVPVPACRLRRGWHVWHAGEALCVLRVTPMREDTHLVLIDQDGDERGLTVPYMRELTRCGPGGERIVIEPFAPAMCGANSYDVHLHDTEPLQVYDVDVPGNVLNWRWVTRGILDPRSPPKKVPLPASPDGSWVLWPGRVHLASTRQYTETFGLVPKLDGRSSIARYGLFVHVTAGFGDTGFKGWWTLELVATEPVVVWPGMKVAQLNYTTVVGELKDYAGRYQNQAATPTESRFHLPDSPSL